jgi:DNA-binding response OmpR family regulator
MSMPVVLTVLPDRSTEKSLGLVLEGARFLALNAATAASALKMVCRTPPSAVILSAALPDMRGAELVKVLRQLPALRRAAILVLSRANSDGSEIECLGNGADDFLVLGVNDLSAIPLRLSRSWRTIGSIGAPIEKGIVRADVESGEVFVSGDRIQALSPREFDLLVYLMRKSPAIARWTDIQREVWSVPEHALEHARETRTIAVHCGRLRHKLGAARHCIAVRRGMGLQFVSGKRQS